MSKTQHRRRRQLMAVGAAVAIGAVALVVALPSSDDAADVSEMGDSLNLVESTPNRPTGASTTPPTTAPTLPPSLPSASTPTTAPEAAPPPPQEPGQDGSGRSGGAESGTPVTGRIIDIAEFTGYGTVHNPELVEVNGMVVRLFDGRALLAALNVRRAQEGLSKLAWNQERAVWAATCAAKNATTKGNGLKHCGWEVLIGGGVSAESSVNIWLASPQHRAVIMGPKATSCGASQARAVDNVGFDVNGAGAMAPA